MALEEVVKQRITQLIERSKGLSVSDEYGQCTDEGQQQECTAWIAAAQNVVHLALESASTPYRLTVDRIAAERHGFAISHAVGTLAAVLKNLLADADNGMLASVADQTRAEVFDNFLDHADAYYRDSRKNEAGAIAGVVFEDTLRRICRKHGITDKGMELDSLISALATRGAITGAKAKRARAAAHVRTKATHAAWDEFALEDVKATIDFTRELIAGHLDG